MQSESTITLSVGQASPFPSAGAGASAIAVQINNGILTAVVQLPHISQQDIDAIKGQPYALALQQTDKNPIGIMLLALQVNEQDSWPLRAPILDAKNILQDWADQSGEGNIFLIVLIDSGTNTIKALRTIGLPTDFLECVRTGIRKIPPGKIDYGPMMVEFAKSTVESVWKNGKQWINDPQAGAFKRAN